MLCHQEVKRKNAQSGLCEGKVFKDNHLLLPKMKIRYDPDADALYIKLRDDEVDHTQEIDENTIVDFNKDGHVIGMEILFVRERNPHILSELQIENLMAA